MVLLSLVGWVMPTVPVGRVGVPVNVGDASKAYPLIEAPAGMVTVPVNVGEAKGAYPVIEAPAGIVTVPVKVGDALGAYVLLALEIVKYPFAVRALSVINGLPVEGSDPDVIAFN